MLGDVIVPLDGSDEAAKALEPAATLARFLESTIRVVSLTTDMTHVDIRERVLAQVDRLDGVTVDVDIRPYTDGVAAAVERVVADAPSSIVCLTTSGRGRSVGLLGSVANEMLESLSCPVLLVGPSCPEGGLRLDDPVLASIDDSDHSLAVLPVVQEWSMVFGSPVELITVLDPAASRLRSDPDDPTAALESNRVHRFAADLGDELERDVDFDVLHDKHPADAIVGRATDIEASVVAMATHGATGLRRIVVGSVTSDVIRHAPCPVLAVRPRDLE